MKAYSSYSVTCDREVNVNFIFENIWVTTSKIEETPSIKIFIEYEVNDYESMADAAIDARPFYLNILGIISFLIDEPLDVFGVEVKSSVFPKGIASLTGYSKEEYLLIDEVDYSNDLNNFLTSISNLDYSEKTLIYSLLDRWRKGYYLEKENDESLIHYDEASLIFFHIFEILSRNFENELKETINDEVNLFTKEILANRLFLKGGKLNSSLQSLSKTVKGLF